ncbi:MAG: hypothetical protein H6510_11860 [Acidobacteria bacterium]|nr:hypothetical protein [Acidobacteriota bacterium]MCB9398501.1 hypothetical protein [Acidobacteriota bacterium]
MKFVGFSLEEGNRYFGRIDGQRFLIGNRVSYLGNKGLMNVKGTAAQKYDRAEYRPEFGFWADFIHPTAQAEGALFHTLNTYDRARFTFTFLQMAAHVPNGDFVTFFRRLLALPNARDYFPDLRLEAGRIVRVENEGNHILEDDQQTDGLMDYLNPTAREVEDTEIIQAAKFVHWAQQDPAHRRLQIEVGIDHFKQKLARYAQQYDLDGNEDRICLVICDIRHQGRAKSSAILAALSQPDPLDALLQLGQNTYPERIRTLRREINRLSQEGRLGQHRYDAARADFVAIN